MELAIVDADALIDFLNGEGAGQKIADRIRAKAAAVTSIVLYEVARGVEPDNRDALRKALRGVRVYPLDARAANQAADLWRLLRSRGHTIDDRDLLTAAIALTVRAPVLTRNVRHFSRVPGLRLEPV